MGLRKRLSDIYRETRFLQVKWYLYWYRWFLKGVVDSLRVRMAGKGGKVGATTSIDSVTPAQECGFFVFFCCRAAAYWSKKYVTRRGIVMAIFLVILVFALYHLSFYLLDYTGLRRHVDPNAVRGYAYCSANESELSVFQHQYPCDFNPKPTGDVIVVTFVNSAWITLAKNWICSAEKVGLKDKLFLVAFEPGVCSHFEGISCYEHPDFNIQGTVFGEPEYQKLVIERTRIILQFLSCGHKLLLADADITFLKDPLGFLRNETEDKDIVFQADSSGVGFIDSFLHYFFRYICGGFIYMKPTKATKLLWLSVLHYQTNFKWNDQAGLNICIRHHAQTVMWKTLSSVHFPNGKQFFDYKQKSEKNFIVHANHLTDTMKISRMIASGVWCDEEGAVEMCKDTKLYRQQCELDSTPGWCLDFIDVCKKEYGIVVLPL